MTASALQPPGTPVQRFRADIQGLRAVAVLLVVADHLVGHPSGGFVGVDVFFVISGFLITSLLLKEGERSGAVSLRGFYVRRIRRILPVALVVLAVTDLASWAIQLPSKAAETLHDSFWAAGFLANVHFADIGTDYFSQGSAPSPVQHYWSLSVEEQFYVVWPLLLLVLFAAGRKVAVLRRRGTLALVATALAGASFAWSVHLTSVAQTDAYFSTLTRAWELGLGAILAVSQAWLLRLPTPVRAAMAWVGLAGIGVACVVITGDTRFPGAAAALPVLATGLVLAAGNPVLGPGRTLLVDNPVVQYVGNISYSLYLWHWPCVVLAGAYYGVGTTRFYVAAAAFSLTLSVLSFHLLEDPIRRSLWLSPKPAGYVSPTLGRWYRDSRRGLDAALVGAAVTVFFLAGFFQLPSESDHAQEVTAANAPLPAAAATRKLTAIQKVIAQALEVTKWGELHPSLDSLGGQRDVCVDVRSSNTGDCVFGDKAGTRTAVVVGDSIAAAWTPAIISALAVDHWKVQQLTMSECPAPELSTWRNRASRNIEYRACTDHRAFVLSFIKSTRPALVIAASLPEFANRIVNVTGPARYAVWEQGNAAFLRDVRPYTQRAVLLSAPPNSGNLQTCVTRVSTPSDCVGRYNKHQAAVALAEQQAAGAQRAGYVNPYDWFCYLAKCPAVVRDVPVMRDGTHTTPEYMRLLAPLLRPVLISRAERVLPALP